MQPRGPGHRQPGAASESLEPSLVDELLDEIGVGQHQPERGAELVAMARYQQQGGIGLRIQDRRRALGASEGEQRGHQLVLAAPGVDPREDGPDVARVAGRRIGGTEEGDGNAGQPERADEVDVPHHHRGRDASWRPPDRG